MIHFGRSSTLKHAQISWFTIHVARAWFHGVLKVLTPLQWRPFLLERLLLDHRMVCVDCSWANPRIDQKNTPSFVECCGLALAFFFAFFFLGGSSVWVVAKRQDKTLRVFRGESCVHKVDEAGGWGAASAAFVCGIGSSLKQWQMASKHKIVDNHVINQDGW